MPVIKSAKKKLRKDKKRELRNNTFRASYKKAVKNAKKSPTVKKLSESSKVIDKAAKKGVIHKNKAARLKSRLAKLAPKGKSKTS